MLRKLEVKGLNNRVNGAWEFNEDLNIITGKNGAGKTTLLKLIWFLISGNLERFIPEFPFRSVSIETDSFSLFIEVASRKGKLRLESAEHSPMETEISIPLLTPDDEEIHKFNVRIAKAKQSSLFFPTFRRLEGGFARDSGYYVEEDSVAYHADRRARRFGDRATELLQDAMSGFSTEISVYDHKFIASISTNDIRDLVTEKYADVMGKRNDLNVNLSKDIIQRISKRSETDDAIRILDGIQKTVESVNEQQDALWKPFSVLAERIRGIFQYEGVRLTASITLGEVKEAIESDKLSAGEQQMLSFLCYNIFCEDAAIFIDEPELSLHVDWQRRLLPTLLEQGTGNQFFIATHSPFIYAKYPDKEIQLSEDRGGD